ncbi:TadE family type IV pilus minor pilin [Allokutzneria sp. NRRL B-24872]|uniref:TadE family type IV pilus minor pilin n=1 Tax=Allokutzneria sp. NRRL B-24872 TaxID=1137961 RepID=UPI000A3AD4BD|nr:TadE family type IV pilus minor pilin [Allokutzneria sp. NRRL B-24872]
MPGDRGAATVEAAVAVAALVLVLGLALTGLRAAADQIRCVDAAREVARLLARGDLGGSAEAFSKIAPSGAALTVRREGDSVSVEVTVAALGHLLPGLRLRGSAFALLEPGVGDSAPGP